MHEFNIDLLAKVIEIVAVVLGGFWFLANLKSQIGILVSDSHNDRKANTERFSQIENELKELVKATVQLARQEERLLAVDMRMQELSNRIEILHGVRKSEMENLQTKVVRLLPKQKAKKKN